jgi:hypothetical protein
MRETSKDKIVRAYQVHKSIRKVSKLLRLSYGTIRNVLKERNALLPWSGFDRVKRWQGGNRGVVTRWIERHPTVVLPRKTRDLARLIGCSLDDAHSWKVARWSKAKRIALKIIPRKIIKSMRYGKLEIELVNGTVLSVEELFAMHKKLQEEKKA